MSVKTLLEDVENNRDKFIELRKGRVGCSDLPALCGLSTFQSPLDLWMRLTGRVEPQEDNDVLWFGRSIEPVVLGLLERREKVKVNRANKVLQNTDYPLLIGSPDAFVTQEDETSDIPEGLAEAKSAGYYQKDQWGPDKAPDAAHLQLQGQMGVSKRSWGYCAGLIGGSVRDFYTPRFEFSREIFDQVYERVENFMKMVKTDIPPEARAGDEPMLELLYGKPKEKVINLQSSAGEMIRLYDSLYKERSEFNRRAKLLSEELDGVEAKLRQQLGDAECGMYGNRAVVLKLQKRKGYEVQPSEKWVLKVIEVNP